MSVFNAYFVLNYWNQFCVNYTCIHVPVIAVVPANNSKLQQH